MLSEIIKFYPLVEQSVKCLSDVLSSHRVLSIFYLSVSRNQTNVQFCKRKPLNFCIKKTIRTSNLGNCTHRNRKMLSGILNQSWLIKRTVKIIIMHIDFMNTIVNVLCTIDVPL